MWKRDRGGSAQAGTNPMIIATLEGGYAVMGDVQFLPGYCVLLASTMVEQLTDLDLPRRLAFLRDMSLLGGGDRARLHRSAHQRRDSGQHRYLLERAWVPTIRVGGS